MLFFPSLAITTQLVFWHDVELLIASTRAFNRWLLEAWGFDRAGRMFCAPCLCLYDPDAAVEELEWVLARGARVIHVDRGRREVAADPTRRPRRPCAAASRASGSPES